MRNFLLAAMAAVALYGAGSGDALGQYSNDGENRYVKIRNASTKLVARRVYGLPLRYKPGQREVDCCWSDDLMGLEEGLREGGHIVINFDDGKSTCYFDVRITSDTGNIAWNFNKLDICRVREITLRDQAPGATRKLTIYNASNYLVTFVRAIPSGRGCCWSRDLLGLKTIRKRKDKDPPTSETVDVEHDQGADAKTCKFDIHVAGIKFGDILGVGQNFEPVEWNFDRIDLCKSNSDKESKSNDQENKPDAAKVTEITLKDTFEDMSTDEEHSSSATFVNRSGYTAEFINIMPSAKDCCWSRNLLGKEVMGSGKEQTVKFKHETISKVPKGTCNFDIRVTALRGQREWSFYTVNLCGAEEKRTITLK
jgi:hypothetical protein